MLARREVWAESQKTPIEQSKNSKSEEKYDFLDFKIASISSHLAKIYVIVRPSLVEVVHAQTVQAFKNSSFDGFENKEVPEEFIEERYKNEILDCVKNFFFEHNVVSFVISEIVARKICSANYPRLVSAEFLTTNELRYTFDLSLADPVALKEWKNFAFKTPGRKRYKDLDKQVDNFIEEEAIKVKLPMAESVEINDWVCFKATLIDKNQMPLMKELNSFFWIKIKDGVVVSPFYKMFLNKKLNDAFAASKFNFDEEDDAWGRGYTFLITVVSILKGGYFSLDTFKNVFKLKNRSEIHSKLVEVFSYRNDLSQRKAIIEEVFNLLLAKHRFEVPKHLVLRRQEDILKTLSKQPDYQVYKAQKDFSLQLESLAEKQLKEEIIIDQIACNENLAVDLKDIGQYLHFFNNKRMQKFVYFLPIVDSIDDLSEPINAGLLTTTVMREKTLNHIIHVLTR